LPSSLTDLNCSDNILDNLSLLPSGLNSLDCSNNLLTQLPVLPSSLYYLFCSYNQIEALPVLPGNLNSLDCSSNQIKCFSAFSFNIEHLYIYNNFFTCLPNYIPAMDSVILDYPLCMDGDFVNNPYGCESAEGILGFTYLDNNSNCSKDSVDSNMTNIPVRLYDNSGTFVSATNTASNGVYNFSIGSGAYTVKIDTTNLPFRPVCNTPGVDSAVSIIATSPLVSDVNFDFGCKPGFDIGTRSVITAGWVFPGQLHEMKVIAGDMSQWHNMHCAAGVSGIVKITVNGPVTYNGSSSGSLVPAVLGNEYTYTISDFGTVNINQAFGLLFTVDTTAAAGADICVHVEVTSAGGDNKPSNNLYNFCYQVVNSHDPNLKEVYPGDLPPRYKGFLTYTIHFQNTGNAPAMNIRLADTLDEHLDPATFQLLNYSHANTYSLNGNILNVRFANIMLPDSSADLQGSQGYIQFKIKIKDYYPAFTQIHNTAYIYFDYNEAVVTNTTTNEIMEATSVSEDMPVENISVYPNPGKGLFNIEIPEANGSGDSQIFVYDLLGNLILDLKVNSPAAKIDLNDQSNGIYILKVIQDKTITTKRLVKQ
jgi:uncharacterized repeat protein (TIGR01451 family)